jgi:hypothetical protein
MSKHGRIKSKVVQATISPGDAQKFQFFSDGASDIWSIVANNDQSDQVVVACLYRAPIALLLSHEIFGAIPVEMWDELVVLNAVELERHPQLRAVAIELEASEPRGTPSWK